MDKYQGIMVSVFMTVYNHGRWVKQAIEGVLSQQTDFRYQIVIGEDCSTDDSRSICIAYQKKYPDKILLLLNEHNLGMNGNGANVSAHCVGKYVAVCEGDDYWTDPHKLQKQVDFLEAHPDYSACYHSVKIVDENGVEYTELDIPAYTSNETFTYPREDVFSMRLPGQSCTVVARNMRYFVTPDVSKAYDECMTNGDQKGVVLYLRYGKIYHMGDCMACYRRTYAGDSWNARTHGREMSFFIYRSFLHMEKYARYCLGINGSSRKYARSVLLGFLRNFSQNRKRGKYRALWQLVSYDVFLFLEFTLWEPLYTIICKKCLQLLVRMSLNKFAELSRDYIIFGTGRVGERAFATMSGCGLRTFIQGFWDNDAGKSGSKFCGRKVSLPCPRARVASQGTFIIIASTKYETAMRKQLMDWGYVYGKDMITWSDWLIQLNDSYVKKYYPWLYKHFFFYQEKLR